MKTRIINAISLILIAYGLSCIKLIAQPVPVEVMFGDKNYLYQHSFSKPFEETKFSFFHTSSLYAFYEQGKKAEIMSQSYVTYTMSPNIKFALGTFYASVPGFKPAAAIHIVKKTKDLLFSWCHELIYGKIRPLKG